MVVIVMVATHTGIIVKIACQIIQHNIICIAPHTAVELNTGLVQRHLCAATNAAANEDVHILFLQEACQSAVTVTGSIYHLRRSDLAVFYIV